MSDKSEATPSSPPVPAGLRVVVTVPVDPLEQRGRRLGAHEKRLLRPLQRAQQLQLARLEPTVVVVERDVARARAEREEDGARRVLQGQDRLQEEEGHVLGPLGQWAHLPVNDE